MIDTKNVCGGRPMKTALAFYHYINVQPVSLSNVAVFLFIINRVCARVTHVLNITFEKLRQLDVHVKVVFVA